MADDSDKEKELIKDWSNNSLLPVIMGKFFGLSREQTEKICVDILNKSFNDLKVSKKETEV